MDTLAEVRSGLPKGGSIDLVEVEGGVRIRAVFSFRHRLDGATQFQTVGSDPYRIFGSRDGDALSTALREARAKIDAKAHLRSLAR